MQREQVEAREFEYSPLVDIQSWSEVPRGNPLFNSLLSFLSYPVQRSVTKKQQDGSALHIERTIFPETTNYPLALTSWLAPALTVRLVYRGDLYAEEMIRRMLGHLQRVLEQVAEDAGRRIGELDLLGEEEWSKLEEWNRTEREYEEATVVELFEEQVKKSPGAVAVSCEGEELSYEELNRRANRIAHRLREMGVGAEVRVGLCLDRSPEMVVSILGVLLS